MKYGGPFESNGERDRIRTCDRLIKSQMLYQLSYAPIALAFETACKIGSKSFAVNGLIRLFSS
jgi:hypothetical protein